jgi:hypothetical protein
MAAYVAESLDMVGGLPGRFAEQRDGMVTNACLEWFLVHMRLLAEFLVRRPAGKDFTANDFSWEKPTSEAAARLGSELWTIASEQVVHFSRRRVPLDLADLEPIDDVLAWMHQAAADVLAVAEESVTAIEEAGWPQAGFLRRTLDEARQALQAAPKDAAHVFARIAERLELDRE